MLARTTARHLTSAKVDAEVRAWTEGKAKRISDGAAGAIASWYHSPSPRDEHITRLSHGLNFSTTTLVDELNRMIREGAENVDELRALIHWAKTF